MKSQNARQGKSLVVRRKTNRKGMPCILEIMQWVFNRFLRPRVEKHTHTHYSVIPSACIRLTLPPYIRGREMHTVVESRVTDHSKTPAISSEQRLFLESLVFSLPSCAWQAPGSRVLLTITRDMPPLYFKALHYYSLSQS